MMVKSHPYQSFFFYISRETVLFHTAASGNDMTSLVECFLQKKSDRNYPSLGDMKSLRLGSGDDSMYFIFI